MPPIGEYYQPKVRMTSGISHNHTTIADRSPIVRKNVALAPCTAPRTSPQDSTKVAAVTPENPVEMIEDKQKTRRTKRATKSKSQPDTTATKGGGKGKRREIASEQYPKSNANRVHQIHPPMQHLPLYHSVPQSMPLPSLQQSQGDSTSLASLTVRFVQLLNRVSPPYGNGELDLNVAMENLMVQKRRLYDVTNVLEGIGLIKKENKNNVSWAQRPAEYQSKESENAEKAMRHEIGVHKECAKQLDNYIDRLSKRVREYSVSQQTKHDGKENDCTSRLFVTKREISSLQNYANDTVIAIRAPSGTSLEVPNPDEGMRPGMRRFQIYLTSPPGKNSGQVNIFLVQHGDNKGNNNTHRGTGERSHQRNVDNSVGGNRLPSPNRSSLHRHHPHLGGNSYPIQEQRVQQKPLKKETDSSRNPMNATRSDDLRPPQLPPTESLPKFISPIEPKKLSRRPKLREQIIEKPDFCPSRQVSNHSSSSSSTISRRPSLKRRPTMPPCNQTILPVKEEPKANDKCMKDTSASENGHLLKKRRFHERAASPIVSATLLKEKSSPPSDKLLFNAPLTPCAISMMPRIANQASFDPFTAGLNSPLLASPATTGFLASPAVTMGGNMQVLGTSGLTTSPFRFSPNFQAGELSPFLPTPTAFRFGLNKDKYENDDELPSALF